jgi:hypothetical protein
VRKLFSEIEERGNHSIDRLTILRSWKSFASKSPIQIIGDDALANTPSMPIQPDFNPQPHSPSEGAVIIVPDLQPNRLLSEDAQESNPR